MKRKLTSIFLLILVVLLPFAVAENSDDLGEVFLQDLPQNEDILEGSVPDNLIIHIDHPLFSIKNYEESKLKILEYAKKKNYIPDSANEDYKKALWREYRKFLGENVPNEKSGYLSIRVLGPGCYACDKLMEEIKEVLTEMNLPADLQHIHDLKEINKYGIIATPGLVINNKIIRGTHVTG